MKTGYSFGSLASFVEQINNTTVKLTRDQTIAGSKTFSSNPISSAAQGTGGSHLTRKDYVDGALALKAPLASPVFTGDAKAQTVAQFDNDTSIATTAFVQRALGNRQTFAWVDGGGTIHPSVAGAMVMLGNSGTYYLPNVTSVAVGATFHCFVQGGGYIAAQSGQTMQHNVNVAGSGSLPIQSGDSFTVTRINDNWFITGTIYTPTVATSENSTRPATTAFVRNVLNSSPTLAGNLTVSGNTNLMSHVDGSKTYNLDGAFIRDSWNNTVVGNRATGGAYAATFTQLVQTELFMPAMSCYANTQNVGYSTVAKFGMYSTGNDGWGEKRAGIWIGSSENDTHPHYLFKFSAYGDIECAYVWATDLHASGVATVSGALTVGGTSTLNGTVYCNQIIANSYMSVPTTSQGRNDLTVANTAWVQRELQHQMSTVSYAQTNGNHRWFKIGHLPPSSDGTLDSFMAQGSFGSWTGTKVPFTMTATNRNGLKVTCTSQMQIPFYFYQLPGGDVDIFIYLPPYYVLQGQTWIAPGGQGTAWKMGEVPDVGPTGTQVYTTYGNTKIYAYEDNPSFTGIVTCTGALSVGGTTTTNGLIVTSGTDFRAGLNVSGGNIIVSNGGLNLPTGGIDSAGTVTSRTNIGFRMINGDYGSFDYQDSATRYILLTNKGDQWGGFNGLRPLAIDLASGKITMCNSVAIQNGLSVDGGTTLLGVSTAPTCGIGTNDTQIATTAFVQSMKIEVAKMLYPVGSYYANDTNSTNPATLFGFGTWVRVEGRALMGCDGTGAGTFGTPGSQGGALTHAHTANGTAITVAQMPQHSHSITMGTSGIGDASGGDGRILTSNSEVTATVSPATYISADSNGSGQTHTHTIQSASSLPPYRVVYLWRRTA